MNEETLFRILQGAVAGLVAAAVVDFNAFRSWKSLDEFRTYDWRVAGMRWLQGLVSGAVSGAGFGSLFG